MKSYSKSYIDLIDDCDKYVKSIWQLVSVTNQNSFPYDDPLLPPNAHWATLYRFFLPLDSRYHGLLTPETVQRMPWTNDFVVNHEERTVHLAPVDQNYSKSLTAAFSSLIQRAIDLDTFRVIHGQHSEPYSIIGANYPVSIERYARSLFGITARGAHLTVFTRDNETKELKIWVPRRSLHLFTYPGKLDTTVAGGVAAGETAYECIIREAEEEASLPGDLVRRDIKAVGCITYVGIKDVDNGGDVGEVGLISPDCVYVFDLEVQADTVCKQNDEEVEDFSLMSIEAVKAALSESRFKANSALVMIDFFVRHGIIDENEYGYQEILSRLHRRLPLPTIPNNLA